jgi:hypothetical protein
MNRKRFMSAGVFHKIPRIDDARLAGLSGSLLSSGSGVRVSPGALFSERLLRGQVLTEER